MDSEGTLVRSIYYGRIGSEATERLLEMFGREGSFLLRDSETIRGAYCLCVRKAPFVHTYRLEHSAEGWYLQRNLLKFGTLESLIEHYRTTGDLHADIIPLTDPLDKRQIPSGFHHGTTHTEFVYMELNDSSSSFAQ